MINFYEKYLKEEEESEEKKIMTILLMSLQYATPSDLMEEAISSLVVLMGDQVDREKVLALRLTGASILKQVNLDAYNLSNLLNFILFGNYQDIGIKEDEIGENIVFGEEERLGLLMFLVNAAKSILTTEKDKIEIEIQKTFSFNPFNVDPVDPENPVGE